MLPIASFRAPRSVAGRLGLVLSLLGGTARAWASPQAETVGSRSDQPTRILWQERFSGPLDWIAPEGQTREALSAIYTVRVEPSGSFLRAHHDGRQKPRLKTIHFGKVFADSPIPLERIRALRWRWRVQQHPAVESDPWDDLAVSLYIVVKKPAFLSSGRGFKLGWLARPGPEGTKQWGLIQIALRAEPTTGEWRSEEVDLCALYRKFYGPCEGESLQYVGIMTDGDNTRSLAEGDYADFELLVDAHP